MLVHMKIGKDVASLLINGEEVISLSYSTSTLSLPSKLDSNGKDQDWIGFYAHNDIYPIDIDCIGIYPYLVAAQVAKRRFVFGQGVEIPENINTSYSGTSVAIDYSFADYTSNFSYPKTGSWNQAFNDNIAIKNRAMSVISHPLPEIVLSSETESKLFIDCKTANLVEDEENFFENEEEFHLCYNDDEYEDPFDYANSKSLLNGSYEDNTPLT